VLTSQHSELAFAEPLGKDGVIVIDFPDDPSADSLNKASLTILNRIYGEGECGLEFTDFPLDLIVIV